jgi:hypothetical protein
MNLDTKIALVTGAYRNWKCFNTKLIAENYFVMEHLEMEKLKILILKTYLL